MRSCFITLLSVFSIAIGTSLAQEAQQAQAAQPAQPAQPAQASQQAQPPAEQPSPLQILTDDNFNNYVMKNNNTSSGTWMIMFFAPWCPHCKHALPNFNELARNLEGTLNVGTVDCDAQTTLRSRFSIGGYPSFIFFHEGRMYPYKGPRTVESWSNFVNEGYKSIQGEEIPLEASMVKNFMKEFGRFFEQLNMLASQRPYVFGGIVGGFILVVALTCFCTSGDDEKDLRVAAEEEKRQQEKKQE